MLGVIVLVIAEDIHQWHIKYFHRLNLIAGVVNLKKERKMNQKTARLIRRFAVLTGNKKRDCYDDWKSSPWTERHGQREFLSTSVARMQEHNNLKNK